jgi:hypothetical protein
MAVLSLPLRGAEVERMPLGFLFRGADQIARGFSVPIAMGIHWKDNC